LKAFATQMGTYAKQNLADEQALIDKGKISGILGGSIDKPSESCVSIKNMYRYKRSGYYWIKPPCAKKALRTYCHFEKNIKNYYYIGGTNMGETLGV
jgi:hypothetical protein